MLYNLFFFTEGVVSYRYYSSSNCLFMYHQPAVLSYYFYGILKVTMCDDIETKLEIRVVQR